MYSRIPSYFYIRVKLEGNDNKGDCDIKHIGRFQKLSHAKYRQKFNITCDNGNNSVEIKCFTYRNDEKETYQIYVEGKYCVTLSPSVWADQKSCKEDIIVINRLIL